MMMFEISMLIHRRISPNDVDEAKRKSIFYREFFSMEFHTSSGDNVVGSTAIGGLDSLVRSVILIDEEYKEE